VVLPKAIPLVTDKWEGEDEDETVRVSTREQTVYLLLYIVYYLRGTNEGWILHPKTFRNFKTIF